MTQFDPNTDMTGNWLLYDGECPLCRNYVRMTELRRSHELHVLNARENPVLVQKMRDTGFEINNGMIVSWHGDLYHGSDAMFILTHMNKGPKWLQKMLNGIFNSRKKASVFYPLCVFARNMALFVTRTKQI